METWRVELTAERQTRTEAKSKQVSFTETFTIVIGSSNDATQLHTKGMRKKNLIHIM